MKFLDNISIYVLLAGSVMLGLAPFVPEPHLWEKLKMLVAGDLVRPIDIFDLIMHGAFPALLILKLLRMTKSSGGD